MTNLRGKCPAHLVRPGQIADKSAMMPTLPIEECLPDVIGALETAGRAVLQAPPGAGKTTRVPLALLEAGIVSGRIVMLEPRRLAARTAAARMAETLGQETGQTVGFRIRGETRVSAATRIEVVTEGILTRMLQADPALEGVGAVIFDEFHERSLNADLGLALTWEARTALREDLLVLVMSATLDAAPVAALMDNAPLISSQGRAFPVQTHWLPRPAPAGPARAPALAQLVLQAAHDTKGGVLVFLPGQFEITRMQQALAGRLPPDCTVCPLYGALPFAQQQAAIRPPDRGRKIVLATAIAETSLTIEDVRVVVDGGQARRARYDPGSGMSRLVTERVSRAEADQRRGRAGRVAKGDCFRFWSRGEEGALPAFAPPEIETADLAGLALELAQWGTAPEALAFLTPPPEGPLKSARALLGMLGALENGTITRHGRAMARLPTHPRLAHMLLQAGPAAADLAALLQNRDPMRASSAGSDLAPRLAAIRGAKRPGADPAALKAIRHEAARLRKQVPQGNATGTPPSDADCAALAFPDRVGLRRPGDTPRYLLSGGKGVKLRPDDALANQRLIVAADLDGAGPDATVRLAATMTESELRALMATQIEWRDTCVWSRRERRVVARRQECFGALVLKDQVWKNAPQEAKARAMMDGVRELGLNMDAKAANFAARVAILRAAGDTLPDLSEAALLATPEHWLLSHIGTVQTAEEWKTFNLLPALRATLNWQQLEALDRLAPEVFVTPMGRKLPISYTGEMPEIALRLQEMFGVTQHPTIGPNRVPLRVTLLSPAQRPIQTTTDIPGFWAGSYADVRKDMRAQYPKHPWPEDPTQADPTLRAKRRPR